MKKYICVIALGLICLFWALCCSQPSYDVVIKGGRIVDDKISAKSQGTNVKICRSDSDTCFVEISFQSLTGGVPCKHVSFSSGGGGEIGDSVSAASLFSDAVSFPSVRAVFHNNVNEIALPVEKVIGNKHGSCLFALGSKNLAVWW